MAYGRDAQAEEILKEAMAKDPNRHEIQLKLLEIYASRKNTNAFEAMASELYAAIGGQPNQVWEKAAEMGRQLDPSNPLYSAAVAGVMAKPAPEAVAAVEPVVPEIEEVAEDLSPNLEFSPEEENVSAEPAVEEPVMQAPDEEGALDFDLDLGSLESHEPSAELAEAAPAITAEDESGMAGVSLDTRTIIPQVIEKQAAQAVESAEADMAPLDMDQALSFGLPDAESGQAVEPSEFLPESEFVQAAEAASETEQIELAMPPEFDVAEEAAQEPIASSPQEPSLDFDFQLDEEVAEAPELASAPASAAMPDLSLDMAGINLGLEESAAMAPTIATTVAEESGADTLWQEVSTKLDLAKAYVEMGDKEGAREILQEVLQEGDEKQQSDAQALLAGIQ
jgi:pilus assembly protein FimV